MSGTTSYEVSRLYNVSEILKQCAHQNVANVDIDAIVNIV